jgi:predicted N-acetyltransferase YhbS
VYTINPELPEEAGDIEVLLDASFGPDRHGKTVYRLREGVAPLPELCFTLRDEGELKATIRYWPILIGGRTPALLLGPIAVQPQDKGRGYGKALIVYSLAQAGALGHGIVLLVGDPDYYERFGFSNAACDGLSLPGPVERHRFQALELRPGALQDAAGMVGKARCVRRAA